jgi:hypothetical protein
MAWLYDVRGSIWDRARLSRCDQLSILDDSHNNVLTSNADPEK